MVALLPMEPPAPPPGPHPAAVLAALLGVVVVGALLMAQRLGFW